jgi:hypothetical protein
MFLRTAIYGLVLTAGAVTTAPASAYLATAGAQSLKIFIADLDVSDGIDAGVSFADGGGDFIVRSYVRSEGYTNLTWDGTPVHYFQGGQWNFQTVPLGTFDYTFLDLIGGNASSVIINGAHLVQASANEPGVQASALANSRAEGLFLLAPKTSITFSTFATTFAVQQGAVCDFAVDGCGYAVGSVNLYGGLYRPGPPYESVQEYTGDLLISWADGDGRTDKPSFASETRTLSITLWNHSDVAAFGILELSVGAMAQADAPLAPVPEPSTYALMFAGLTLLLSNRRLRTGLVRGGPA